MSESQLLLIALLGLGWLLATGGTTQTAVKKPVNMTPEKQDVPGIGLPGWDRVKF